jgi:hypothetical protein
MATVNFNNLPDKVDLGKLPDQQTNGSTKTLGFSDVVGLYNPRTTMRVAGQVASGVNNAIGGVISKVAEPFQEHNQVAKALGGLLQPVMQKFEQFKTKYPEAGQDIEDIVNIMGLLPTGKAVTQPAQVAKTAAKISPSLATSAVTTAKAIGTGLKATARGVTGLTLRPSPQTANKIIAFKAQVPELDAIEKIMKAPITPAQTATEKGISGITESSIGIQAQRIKNNLYKNKIKPTLENSTETITKEELFKPIEDKIASTVSDAQKKELIDTYNILKKEYKNTDSWNMLSADKLKDELDATLPEKIFRGKPVSSAYQELSFDMANAIREKIANVFRDVELKKDYYDYGNLKEISNLGSKAVSTGVKIESLRNLFKMLVTPISSVGGKYLYKLGNAFEFIADKGVKTFGEYLESKGFKMPPTKDGIKQKIEIKQYEKTLKKMSEKQLQEEQARLAKETAFSEDVASQQALNKGATKSQQLQTEYSNIGEKKQYQQTLKEMSEKQQEQLGEKIIKERNFEEGIKSSKKTKFQETAAYRNALKELAIEQEIEKRLAQGIKYTDLIKPENKEIIKQSLTKFKKLK